MAAPHIRSLAGCADGTPRQRLVRERPIEIKLLDNGRRVDGIEAPPELSIRRVDKAE
jgi:hypothetical protein